MKTVVAHRNPAPQGRERPGREERGRRRERNGCGSAPQLAEAWQEPVGGELVDERHRGRIETDQRQHLDLRPLTARPSHRASPPRPHRALPAPHGVRRAGQPGIDNASANRCRNRGQLRSERLDKRARPSGTGRRSEAPDDSAPLEASHHPSPFVSRDHALAPGAAVGDAQARSGVTEVESERCLLLRRPVDS